MVAIFKVWKNIKEHGFLWKRPRVPKIFYHCTPIENWARIQESGHLWGNLKNPDYRYTYVAPDLRIARRFAGWTKSPTNTYVMLKVKYRPRGRPKDNFSFWIPWGMEHQQLRIYVPVGVENLEVVEIFERQSNGTADLPL